MYTLCDPAEEKKKKQSIVCLVSTLLRVSSSSSLLLILSLSQVRMNRCGSIWWWMQAGVWRTLGQQSYTRRLSLPARIYAFGLHALTPFTKTTKATRKHKIRNASGIRAPAMISKIKLCEQLQSLSVPKGMETVTFLGCTINKIKFGYI